MVKPILDLKRTALLSMDLQNAVASIYTKNEPEFLPRVATVLKAARERGLRVMRHGVGDHRYGRKNSKHYNE